MGFLDSFNDEESKINSGTGRYRDDAGGAAGKICRKGIEEFPGN